MPELSMTIDALIEKVRKAYKPVDIVPDDCPAEKIAARIEHTLLKPNATPKDIERLCLEAKTHGFRSVCVNPCYIGHCNDLLQDTEIKIVTVVGFPLGGTYPCIKAKEAEYCISSGAHEIDMVINVGRLKAREYDFTRYEIAQVVSHSGGKPVKVIIETALLEWEEKVAAIHLAIDAGARYVKTSTGFADKGATIEDVQLMRYLTQSKIGVKASGGIRSKEDALLMIAAGADLLGTSNGVTIVRGGQDGKGY